MNTIDTVLAKVAEALNGSGIVWGVGASVLLNRYGLEANPVDIDIVVSVPDIEEADRLLSSLGEKQPVDYAGNVYVTDYFYEYIIGGVNVDVMAGFKINLSGSVFEYIFDQASVPNHFIIKNTIVPFTTLEDWYVLYQLMPGKEEKAKRIAGYFLESGIQYPSIFRRMQMNTNLPTGVKDSMEKLLRACLNFIQ